MGKRYTVPLLFGILFSGKFTVLYAQTEKGSFSIGTSVTANSFSFGKTSLLNAENTITTYKFNDINLSLNPSLMHFIQENLAVGGSVGLQYANNKYDFGDYNTPFSNYRRKNTVKTITPTIGAWLRYYPGKKNKSGMVYLQPYINAGYSWQKNDYLKFNDATLYFEKKGTILLGAAAYVGYEYFLTEKHAFSIYMGSGYQYNISKTNNNSFQEKPFRNLNKNWNKIVVGISYRYNIFIKKQNEEKIEVEDNRRPF